MKLTKYGHACIVLEKGGERLVIDPGEFTPDFGGTDNIVAVVITHEHTDHYGEKHLKSILAANPEVKIFTTQEVGEKLNAPNVVAVNAGQQEVAGSFELTFNGDMHATAHPSIRPPHNTSVMVDGVFFCPGDSFTKPDKPVAVLALPSNAPWAQIGETIDYMVAVGAKRCVPTHDGLLSDNGHLVYNGILTMAAESNGLELVALKPGESLEL